jgi:hypothetical protein
MTGVEVYQDSRWESRKKVYFLHSRFITRSAMTKFRLSLFVLPVIILYNLTAPVRAQAGISVVSDTIALTFPNSATFQAEFASGSNITSVVLEYGVDQLTCGTVVAKAFPTFTVATDVKVKWSWQMQQSGSLPPGASIWWQWQVQDASGAQFTSSRQTITWLDSTHNWQVISGGDINLHYYDGGQTFGQTMHDAAAAALVRLTQDVGLGTDKPVDIYLYANSIDMQAAVLFQPDWAGGQAFPEDNIVIIGGNPIDLEWNKTAEAHELTHVLVGHLTFTCLGSIPTWLNEGLAMYGQGGALPDQVALLDQAKATNKLPALSSLEGNFPEDATRANLAYAESSSVANFLIKTYGREKMTAFLISLRDGTTIDEGLRAIFGFNTDGLESAWRISIGSAPRTGASNPTPIPTATQVPTILPVGAVPIVPVTPTPRQTQVQASATPGMTGQVLVPTATPVAMPDRPGISREVVTMVAIGMVGCILAVLAISLLIIFIIRRHSRRQK